MRVAITQTAEALVADFGIVAPRIAIAGLNPHAGEQGHFGDDEPRVIAPAIDARAPASPPRASTLRSTARASPTPSSAITSTAASTPSSRMYHDQGLIPVKIVDFEESVNITLGLPIVRTSPDHGVAHDIAGQKPRTTRARPTSFAAALRLAREITARRPPMNKE